MIVLGIETSCDETGVGIIEFDPAVGVGSQKVLAEQVASSVDQHVRFGGVVPEIASRAHMEAMSGTVQRALDDAGISRPDAVAVTIGPGLVGCLMVGVAAAKAYALAWGVPLYGVNHLVAHIAVDTLEHGPLPPALAMLVSGGHTNLLLCPDLVRYPVRDLGGTIDDAAGEAFDKVARILGLGYPGGPVIDALAQEGDPYAVRFPRGVKKDNYHFSFSGLKTAVARYIELEERAGNTVNRADVAASFQEAVADSISSKAVYAAGEHGVSTIVLGGGASANTRIRELTTQRAEAAGMQVRIPRLSRCTDNGIMVAALAMHSICAGGKPTDMRVSCQPQLGSEVTLV